MKKLPSYPYGHRDYSWIGRSLLYVGTAGSAIYVIVLIGLLARHALHAIE